MTYAKVHAKNLIQLLFGPIVSMENFGLSLKLNNVLYKEIVEKLNFNSEKFMKLNKWTIFEKLSGEKVMDF